MSSDALAGCWCVSTPAGPHSCLRGCIVQQLRTRTCRILLLLVEDLNLYMLPYRDHKFVIKGGEDARLDERIEQIFVVMSGLAAAHTGCVTRGLHKALLTYDVVPASPRLGLLGFVEVSVGVRCLYCNMSCQG